LQQQLIITTECLCMPCTVTSWSATLHSVYTRNNAKCRTTTVDLNKKR